MMLKFFLPLVLWAAFVGCSSLQNADISQYMEDSVNEYKLQIHKAHQQRRRVRKSISVEDFIQSGKTAFESQIYNITPWQLIPSLHPVEIEPFKIQNKQYLAVVNFKNLQNEHSTTSQIFVANETTQRFELLQNFTTSGAIDFEFADFGVEKYAVFLDHVGKNWFGGATYEKFFQLQQFLPNENLETPFQYRSRVRTLGARSVKVFVKNYKNFFVTANSFYELGERYHVKSTMHMQGPFGYELVQTFETTGAQDVEVFMIDGVRYIIFANHIDNTGNVDIYSAIFRERPIEKISQPGGPFDLHQRLATHGARDFEYFSFEDHHYLVVANEFTQVTAFDSNYGHYVTLKEFNVDSIIYWWTGSVWVEWQKIPTYGAVKWTFFTSDFGDPMLVVANSKAQATIYTYDHLRGFFKPTQVQGLSPFPGNAGHIPDVRSVMAFKLLNMTYLAVANFNETSRSGYNIFKLSFEQKPVPKLDQTVPEIVRNLLTKMKTELELVKETLSEVLLTVTSTVMTKSTEQNITGTFTFDRISVNGSLVTNNTFYTQNISVNPIEESAKESVRLKEIILEQEKRIRQLQNKLNDAVKINEAIDIAANKTFMKDVTVSQNLVSNNTRVNGLLDNTSVTDLKFRSWSKTREQTLTGYYTLNGNTTVLNNMTVAGLLNGQSTSSYLTVNTEQNVTSVKEFTNTLHLQNNITLRSFTLNGFQVPEDFVTEDGAQTITGRKSFSTFTANDNIVMQGLLDGVNITEFNENKMTLSTEQIITNDVIFESGFMVNSDVIVDGLVDGVNLTALQDDIQKLGKTQNIPGSKVFNSVHIQGSATTETINSYNFTNAVTLDVHQVITADHVFNNDVAAQGNLLTSSRVDGIRLSTEAVTLLGQQTISGHKTFDASVHFDSNLEVIGLVDNVNISSWTKGAVNTDSGQVIPGNKSFLSSAISNHLSAHFLNGIDLNTLKAGLIQLSIDEELATPFAFENVQVEEDLKVYGQVNGYRIPSDFVTLNTNQTIHGPKTFVTKTTVTNVLKADLNLNGEEFSSFYADVVKNGTNDTITAEVGFTENVYFKNIEVTDLVNNLSIPNDIVTINTVQNISGVMTFTKRTTFQEVVDTYIVHVNSTVDGIDISEMERNAVYKDRNQTINGSVIFVSGIDCKQNLSVAGLINGVNLTELYNTTVRISKDQEVLGRKEFVLDVQFYAPVTSPGLINNINLTHLSKNLLRKKGDQTINSNVLFEENVHVIHNVALSNESLVNNIHLNSFVENAVKKTGKNIVIGSVTYPSLTVTNITSSTVDGVNMSNILLTKNNQTIKGSMEFSTVHVNSISTLANLVNNIDLTEVHATALKLSGNQNITARYNIQSVQVRGDVLVSVVNGIDLHEFNTSAVHLSTEDIIFGIKKIQNVSFGNVEFKGLLNGINVTLLVEDVLTKNGDQEVCLRPVFTQNITINSSESVFHDIYTGLVSKINISNLAHEAVYLDENKVLNGSYYFVSGLSISLNLTTISINGYNIEDYVTTYGNQSITGYKQFNDTDIRQNFDVNGLIDAVNVTELFKRRMALNSDQQVKGKKQFNNVILSNDVNLSDNATVNGIDLSQSLIGVNQNVVIGGHKNFTSVLVNHNIDSLTGVVNDVNVREFQQNALKSASEVEQTLSEDQTFIMNLTVVGNLTVHGLINGIKVGEVGNYSETVGDSIKNDLLLLTSEASNLCTLTTELVPVASYEKFFDGIRKVGSLSLTGQDFGAIHSYVVDDAVYIAIARSSAGICGPAYVLNCSITMQCSVLQTIQTNAPKLEFFQYNGYRALYVAHWTSGFNDSCPTIPEIYTFSDSQGYFLPYQTLNTNLETTENVTILNSSLIMSQFLGNAYGRHYRNSDPPMKVKTINARSTVNRNPSIAVKGNEGGHHFVDILLGNGTAIRSLKKIQRISTSKGKHFSVGHLKNDRVVLAIADDMKQLTNLYVQNRNSGKFNFYQRLPLGATSVKLNSVGKKSILSFTDPFTGFGLCIWKGVSGYAGCTSIQLTDTKHVDVAVTSKGAYSVGLAENRLLIFESIFKGNDDVYDAEIC